MCKKSQGPVEVEEEPVVVGGAPGKGPAGVTRVTRVKEGSEGARTGCLHVR